MATTGSYGALPTIEEQTRTTSLNQTDTTNATQQQTQLGQQGQTQSQSQMNVYNPQQQALQGNVLDQANNLLTGNVSNSFGLPQSVWDAAYYNFNKYQAPQLAAQHGAGSPAISSSMNELNLQLAGLSGQNAMSNALGAFDAAAKYAFNPLGSNAANVSNQTTQQNNSTTSNQTANKQALENTFQQNASMDLGALYLLLTGYNPFGNTGGTGGGGGGIANGNPSTPFQPTI